MRVCAHASLRERERESPYCNLFWYLYVCTMQECHCALCYLSQHCLAWISYDIKLFLPFSKFTFDKHTLNVIVCLVVLKLLTDISFHDSLTSLDPAEKK